MCKNLLVNSCKAGQVALSEDSVVRGLYCIVTFMSLLTTVVLVFVILSAMNF